MSHGRSRLYGQSDVAERGDVAAAAVAPLNEAGHSRDDRVVSQELDTLRSINAHLIRQIAVLKQREAQAQRLADRDGLTGLYNRRRMLELLDGSISDASQQRHRVGLLFIDLDGFKGINDDYGHAAGDKLLITVASRISARARTGDFVCRYGGDEFVVILPRIADIGAVHQVAASIRKRVALSYRIDGADLRVTAAIGVAMFPDEAHGAGSLLRTADESMYREKSQAADSGGLISPAPPSRRRDDKSRRRKGMNPRFPCLPGDRWPLGRYSSARRAGRPILVNRRATDTLNYVSNQPGCGHGFEYRSCGVLFQCGHTPCGMRDRSRSASLPGGRCDGGAAAASRGGYWRCAPTRKRLVERVLGLGGRSPRMDTRPLGSCATRTSLGSTSMG